MHHNSVVIQLEGGAGASMARRIVSSVVVVSAAVVLGGCSGSGAAGGPGTAHGQVSPAEMQRLQQVHQSCSQNSGRLTQYIGVDLSGSGAASSIEDDRDKRLRSVVEKVAVCGGDLHVVGFTSSVAATAVLFDGALNPTGATDNARLRSVPGLVDKAIGDIDTALAKAEGILDRNGSDITAQYGLASEIFGLKQATGAPQTFALDLLTDGVQTVGANLNTAELTKATATEFARQLSAPSLPAGTQVTLSGIGRTAGTAAPTDYVDALKTFHSTFCERATGSAQSCDVVTDATT